LLALGAAPALEAADDEWRFRVLLDDREIGTHSFRVTREGGIERVDIDAEFKVKFLGITVYSYRHRNREVWRDGCLESIESETRDGRESFHVKGSREGARFKLDTQSGKSENATDCVMTFAYWRRDFLSRQELLNAQNGDFVAIEVEPAKPEKLEIDGRGVETDRYRLKSADGEIDISLWYQSPSGTWFSLESRVEGGRTIRYLPLESESGK